MICTRLSTVLLSFCKLTTQEFYDLIVLHINDESLRPKCPNCNSTSAWNGSFKRGYMETCLSDDCKSYIRGKGLRKWYANTDEEVISNMQRSKSLERWKDTTYEDRLNQLDTSLASLNSCEGKANSAYSLLLSHGNLDDICNFYIAISYEGLFKYGVAKDVESRIRWSTPYRKYKIIVRDSRLKLANLEWWIKVNLGENSEYISWNLVPKFISLFGKYYKLIIIDNISNELISKL